MKDVEQFFQNSHYNINRIFLSISGLWPFYTKTKRYAMYLAMILFVGPAFTFQILGVMEILRNTFELVDSLPMLFLSIVMINKIIYTAYNISKIKLLLTKLQQYCLSPKSNEEYKIHNSHAVYGRNLSCVYAGIVISHNLLFTIATLLTKLMHTKYEKNETSSNEEIEVQIGVPYRVNYMVDLDTYYALIFIHSSTCVMFYIYLSVAFDILYITLVEHCAGMFAAIRYRLENALSLENDSDDLITKEKCYSNVVYSVRRHAETMQFVNIMNAVFSPPLFVHVGSTILILSVLGYQVLTNRENVNRLLKHASFLNALTINLFFENWQGQKIIDSSEKVFESAYNAEWYNMPIAARKLLVMIMMKSRRPMVLMAGKFILLSYITFNAAIRTSASYFMLLRSVS